MSDNIKDWPERIYIDIEDHSPKNSAFTAHAQMWDSDDLQYIRADLAQPDDLEQISKEIKYPEEWDTVAYPTVASALSEVLEDYRCVKLQSAAALDVEKLARAMSNQRAIRNGGDPQEYWRAYYKWELSDAAAIIEELQRSGE